MLDAAPEHDPSEQTTPPPAAGLATCPDSDCDHPCIIDLAGATPAANCEKKVNAPNQESEHDLLQQLSASAIESCRDLAEPRCYLHVLGFKSPEMETAYSAHNRITTVTGHRLLAILNATYLLVRIVNFRMLGPICGGHAQQTLEVLFCHFLADTGSLVLPFPVN